MASRKLLRPNTAVYQAGRGSEPMIEVGSAICAEALYIASSLALCPRSEIEGFALGRNVLHQRAVGLGQRCAGIAEAVDDGVAAVAAEIPQRHLDAGGRLPALVLGKGQHAPAPLYGPPVRNIPHQPVGPAPPPPPHAPHVVVALLGARRRL